MIDEKHNQMEPLPDVLGKKDSDGEASAKTYIANAHASGDGSLKRNNEAAEKASGRTIKDDKEKY